MARVAARFCLLYDDNRWSKRNSGSTSEKSGDGNAEKDEPTGIKSPVPAESGSKLDVTGMKLLYPEGMTPFTVEQDLLRTLAEVRFIFAEVFTFKYIKGVMCTKGISVQVSIDTLDRHSVNISVNSRSRVK